MDENIRAKHIHIFFTCVDSWKSRSLDIRDKIQSGINKKDTTIQVQWHVKNKKALDNQETICIPKKYL